MSIKRAIRNAFSRMQKQKRDRVYILVDIHGTVLKSNYQGMAKDFYPLAKEALQAMSKDENFCLILWSCTPEDMMIKYLDFFKSNGILFDYCNENPEVQGRIDWADYSKKLHYDIMVDDKAGFNPHVDWRPLLTYAT